MSSSAAWGSPTILKGKRMLLPARPESAVGAVGSFAIYAGPTGTWCRHCCGLPTASTSTPAISSTRSGSPCPHTCYLKMLALFCRASVRRHRFGPPARLQTWLCPARALLLCAAAQGLGAGRSRSRPVHHSTAHSTAQHADSAPFSTSLLRHPAPPRPALCLPTGAAGPADARGR